MSQVVSSRGVYWDDSFCHTHSECVFVTTTLVCSLALSAFSSLDQKALAVTGGYTIGSVITSVAILSNFYKPGLVSKISTVVTMILCLKPLCNHRDKISILGASTFAILASHIAETTIVRELDAIFLKSWLHSGPFFLEVSSGVALNLFVLGLICVFEHTLDLNVGNGCSRLPIYLFLGLIVVVAIELM